MKQSRERRIMARRKLLSGLDWNMGGPGNGYGRFKNV